MWERFGYYLMMAIFMFYLKEHLKMPTEQASSIYGKYIALIYLSPLFGGLLADRVLGYRRSVIMGAALLALGYFLLAMDTMSTFYVSLGVLILGNGLFKPNISTLVGNLYPQGDMRRDSAFSIFYMGINVGALISPFAASYMRKHYSWGAAFATAGVGLVVGMIIFSLLHKWLAVADQRSSAAAVLDVPLPKEYEDRPDPPAVERQRIRALVIMCGIVMLFWMAFHQNGSTLALWAKDNTDRSFAPWLLGDEENFAAVNPFFVIILTPVLVGFFSFLRKRGLEPSTPGKIGLGMLLTGAAFAVMVGGSLAGGDTGRVSALWLIASYFVVTIAELFLSPMGLSMVTKLAPRRMTAMLMGVWFVATSIGNYLSGYIGKFWDVWPHHRFFGLLVVSSLFAAFLVTIQLRQLKAAMPKESG
jgi:POT family proton-dependent oligopeptide transporter